MVKGASVVNIKPSGAVSKVGRDAIAPEQEKTNLLNFAHEEE